MSVELEVRRSAIKGGGVARVHSQVAESMGLKPGDNAVVYSEHKAVIIKVFGDTLIGSGEIRLRSNDMAKLKVNKGDKVSLDTLEPMISGKRGGFFFKRRKKED